MIYLASSSSSRAKILKDNNIEFKQIPFDYDESGVNKKNIYKYPYEIVTLKQKQFMKAYKNITNVLFADSVVAVNNQIFGKAKDDEEALFMIEEQSGNYSSVISAFIFNSEDKIITNLSITTYKFAKFNKDDIENYIKTKEYKGKAGAMMIEGFNKKYIVKQKGNTSTAMGLNIEALKAYL
ncbi:septum formation protein Maf [Campylobacter blaseri]|uniref:Nucleoside triphosphate pyrophosphatase n=1 Tax=Campylobacter blaseri TaxID=2042961 RepID=A0A2P8R065_9BACT|nr:septum formation inhibitor Maf [Campylobacter blaseri]PSM51889.1 septum formation inhibitor Maf [Campylobacter blaseri]PSM53673.1 septum formation inhibitor Maf [Campylobacter blaseri]QKF85774.1 septum formation protein Maf [Campylobacter blaseri]